VHVVRIKHFQKLVVLEMIERTIESATTPRNPRLQDR